MILESSISVSPPFIPFTTAATHPRCRPHSRLRPLPPLVVPLLPLVVPTTFVSVPPGCRGGPHKTRIPHLRKERRSGYYSDMWRVPAGSSPCNSTLRYRQKWKNRCTPRSLVPSHSHPSGTFPEPKPSSIDVHEGAGAVRAPKPLQIDVHEGVDEVLARLNRAMHTTRDT